jgi:DNA-3-methyladenine glycosylase II
MEKPVPPVYGKINYIDFLSKDPLLAAVLAGQELRTINKTDNVTFYLYSTIIQQQLSGRVGEVILKRFMDMFGGRAPTSAEVVATLVENFRAIGISVAKAGYIKNIAQFDLDNGLDMKKLSLMTDEEVITYITAIKGIGKWTAHLFLMAALGREDVFPADDLILQKAVETIYGLDRKDKKAFMEKMLAVSSGWSPYSTFVSMHLWRWYGGKK